MRSRPRTGAQFAALVTAAALGATGPCRARLLAQCRAAAVRLREALVTGADGAGALGAYEALA